MAGRSFTAECVSLNWLISNECDRGPRRSWIQEPFYKRSTWVEKESTETRKRELGWRRKGGNKKTGVNDETTRRCGARGRQEPTCVPILYQASAPSSFLFSLSGVQTANGRDAGLWYEVPEYLLFVLTRTRERARHRPLIEWIKWSSTGLNNIT